MFYVLVIDGVAVENIPEINPALGDTPIDERFSAEFLEKTVRSKEEVQAGWLYDEATETFVAPPPIEDAEPSLEEYKTKEYVYDTLPTVELGGKFITVNEASELWLEAVANQSKEVSALQEAISSAKDMIHDVYLR